MQWCQVGWLASCQPRQVLAQKTFTDENGASLTQSCDIVAQHTYSDWSQEGESLPQRSLFLNAA